MKRRDVATTPEQIQLRLAAPFPQEEVGFKPQTVKGDRAIPVWFLNARAIQERLDEVVGTENWEDHYEMLPDSTVLCRLRIRMGDSWITKMDVGCPSDQPDPGDRMKAAFSDAIKRTAVKFGVGRYLYKIKSGWQDFDPNKKRFLQIPRLPAWALPGSTPRDTRPQPAPPTQQAPPPKPKESEPPQPTQQAATQAKPKINPWQRLREVEEDMVKKGLCQMGELVPFIEHTIKKAPGGPFVLPARTEANWDQAVGLAVADAIKQFQSECDAEDRANSAINQEESGDYGGY